MPYKFLAALLLTGTIAQALEDSCHYNSASDQVYCLSRGTLEKNISRFKKAHCSAENPNPLCQSLKLVIFNQASMQDPKTITKAKKQAPEIFREVPPYYLFPLGFAPESYYQDPNSRYLLVLSQDYIYLINPNSLAIDALFDNQLTGIEKYLTLNKEIVLKKLTRRETKGVIHSLLGKRHLEVWGNSLRLLHIHTREMGKLKKGLDKRLVGLTADYSLGFGIIGKERKFQMQILEEGKPQQVLFTAVMRKYRFRSFILKAELGNLRTLEKTQLMKWDFTQSPTALEKKELGFGFFPHRFGKRYLTASRHPLH